MMVMLLSWQAKYLVPIRVITGVLVLHLRAGCYCLESTSWENLFVVRFKRFNCCKVALKLTRGLKGQQSNAAWWVHWLLFFIF